jgi:mono/diheme cytochrome c family protein
MRNWLSIRSLLLAGAMLLPATSRADTDPVSRGKYLVYAGDCAACHTAPGGQPFAGGVVLKTPFGTMATPNITPDKATGIGDWSDDQFYTLFHDGKGPHGEFIYPGFPYPWFTHVTRDDVLAIKAYLDTLPPVNAPKPANHLMFPLNIRTAVLGWNILYFKPGEFQPDPSKSAQINRGAYLVEGLGHCSDCHTPKNALMAPDNSRPFAGGVQDNWYAPNISSDPKEGIGGWTDRELVTYLRTGVSRSKGVVLGPMAQTIQESLSHLTNSDLTAIVAYLKSTKPQTSYQPRTPILAADQRPGAELYLSYCASCHQQNGEGVKGKIPALADNGAVTAKGPENVIRVVLGGLRAQGSYGPMPGFGTAMTSEQVADVTNYVRSAWTNQAPASASSRDVSAIAKETSSVVAGTQACPPLGTSPLDTAIADPASGVPDLLKNVSDENVLQSANKIIRAVKAKVPDAPQADIVNELTDAYCPVVAADTTLDTVDRWNLLNQFGETVYTQLADHGQQ